MKFFPDFRGTVFLAAIPVVFLLQPISHTRDWIIPALLAAVAALLIYAAATRILSMNSSCVRIALALVVIFFISAFVSQHPPDISRLLLWGTAAGLLPLVAAIVQSRLAGILLLTLISAAALHAQWGISQFIIQHDLGFQYAGESVLSSDIPAVAKFAAGDTKLIRAYGPYLHANSFAGVLTTGLVFLLLARRYIKNFQSSAGRAALIALTGMLLLGILLSFSRAAWVGGGFFIAASFFLFPRVLAIKVFAIAAILAVAVSPLIYFRLTDHEDRAAPERVSGSVWAVNIIREQSRGAGIGIGRYTDSLAEYMAARDTPHAPWQIAPVHSAPLLLIAEVGIPLGLLALALLIWHLPNARSWLFLLPLLPLVISDHFFLTQIPLLWAAVVYGFCVARNTSTIKRDESFRTIPRPGIS